jgi:peptidyl-prolyl cis-trans isomerase B (cyclophilin B)
VSTNQHRREAAKRKLERQQQRRVQRARQRKRTALIVAASVLIVAVGATVWATLGRGGASSSPLAATPTSATTAPPGPCSFPSTPGEPAARPVSPPTDTNPPKNGTVAVTMTTNQGVLPITLNRAHAPCTVDSFVHLAKAGFYNNTPCHRLVTQGTLKVLQCGDPTGTGTGGPGYSIPDEPPTGLKPGPDGVSIYPAGAVAMAKSSSPNSGGSQFFLVYADSELPPDYTIFGSVAPAGVKVLQKIAAAGDDGSMDSSAGGGKPKLATNIQTVTSAP